MKSQFIVSALIGSSLLAGADTVSVAVSSPATEGGVLLADSQDIVSPALQKVTSSLERIVALLVTIKDKPTAELHAFDVGNLFIEYETLMAEYETAVAGRNETELRRIAPDAFRRYKFFSKRFRVQCRRLSRADYYDCLDLRTAMGDDVEADVSEPEKERPLLPPEQVEQLAASVGKAQALYLRRHANVQGGPGFTRETAWVMLDTKMSVIAQEYEIMKQVIRQNADRQSLVYEGERWYDLLEYDIKVEGVTYTVDQWFDITLHADTMSARAQAEAEQRAAAVTTPAEGTSAVGVPSPAAEMVPASSPQPQTAPAESNAVPRKSRHSSRSESGVVPAQQPATTATPASEQTD